MNRFYRTTFVILGSVCVHFDSWLVFAHAPVNGHPSPTGSFPIHIFLAAITASITASLLWIGFSGELGTAAAGAIDLAVFYVGLTIFQLLPLQQGSQRLLRRSAFVLGGCYRFSEHLSALPSLSH